MVAPSTAAAGAALTSTSTLSQLVNDDYWHNKQLGSVRITPPAGFVLTGASAVRGSTTLTAVIAGGSVTVNGINLSYAGKTAVVTIQTTIPCGVAGATTWSVIAHQTSSYDSGYAKVLVRDASASQLSTTVTACSLAFVAGRQPAATAVAQTITSAAGDPSGPAIQVQLRNGNGGPASQAGVAVGLAVETGTAGAVLGGTKTGTTGGTGVVSFAPTIDRFGHGYTLRASAGSGITDAISASFDVDEVVVACSGACSGTDQEGDTTATVSGSSNGGTLTVSVGAEDSDCNNAVNQFYVSTSEVASFSVTPATTRTLVTMGLAAALGDEAVLQVRGLLQPRRARPSRISTVRSSRRARPVSSRGASTA